MALLMRGQELIGPVRILRRSPPSPEALAVISFEAEFVLLPGAFLLVDDDGAHRRITVTTVFPSLKPLRAEAQLEG